jgi:hypothetical protein
MGTNSSRVSLGPDIDDQESEKTSTLPGFIMSQDRSTRGIGTAIATIMVIVAAIIGVFSLVRYSSAGNQDVIETHTSQQ